MPVRGVRGATTAPVNEAGAILSATRELLSEMVARNGIDVDDIAAAYLTVTDDLDAAFPAQAARELGWRYTPLLDACEIPVPGSLARCIRVLLLWNTALAPAEVIHIYRNEAVALRPDLATAGAAPGSSRDTPGSSRDVPGSSRQVPGSSRHTPGSSRHTPGSSRHTPGERKD